MCTGVHSICERVRCNAILPLDGNPLLWKPGATCAITNKQLGYVWLGRNYAPRISYKINWLHCGRPKDIHGRPTTIEDNDTGSAYRIKYENGDYRDGLCVACKRDEERKKDKPRRILQNTREFVDSTWGMAPPPITWTAPSTLQTSTTPARFSSTSMALPQKKSPSPPKLPPPSTAPSSKATAQTTKPSKPIAAHHKAVKKIDPKPQHVLTNTVKDVP